MGRRSQVQGALVQEIITYSDLSQSPKRNLHVPGNRPAHDLSCSKRFQEHRRFPLLTQARRRLLLHIPILGQVYGCM
jgi:hypothetical protein